MSATRALDGTSPSLDQIHTASTQIPATTTSIAVTIGLGGSLSFQPGSHLAMTRILAEISTASQSAPSAWPMPGPSSGPMAVYTGTFT